MRILDVGAGASGFQFLLSSQGLDVTSVDPMINPSSSVDWILGLESLLRLNRAFGGRVSFLPTYLEEANLPSSLYDRAFVISVLEHLSLPDCISLVGELKRILRPGGLLVATVDLFLDCQPFAEPHRNRYGSNLDLHAILSSSGMTMKVGEVDELFGFPQFDHRRITSRMDDYLCANRTLSQCFVLEKPCRS